MDRAVLQGADFTGAHLQGTSHVRRLEENAAAAALSLSADTAEVLARVAEVLAWTYLLPRPCSDLPLLHKQGSHHPVLVDVAEVGEGAAIRELEGIAARQAA